MSKTSRTADILLLIPVLGRPVKAFALVFGFCTSIIFLPQDSASAMTFRDSGNGGNCLVGCEYLVLDGDIDENTVTEFLGLVEKYGGHPPQLILINSNGGLLMEGLKLGRLFHDLGLSVFVGVPHGTEGDLAETTFAGSCFSACAYALIGGKQHGIYDPVAQVGNEGSVIGFHQFYPEATKQQQIVDINGRQEKFSEDQLVSGLIISYLFDIGADPRIFTFASQSSGDGINIPTWQKMIELGIYKSVYSGFSGLQIDAYNNNFVLFSKRVFEDGFNDMQQVSLTCKKGKLNVLFTVGNHAFSGNSLVTDKMFEGFSNVRISFGERLSYDATDMQFFTKEISEWYSDDGSVHYVQVQLSKDQAHNLLQSNHFAAAFEVFRYRGQFSSDIDITDKDRFAISALMHNCG